MTSSRTEHERKPRVLKTRPAQVARANLHPQGLRTRATIVGAARKLLLEYGSLEFTLREIAARAGISISNLQYYFPNRLSVLRAVLEPAIEAYMRDLRRVMDQGGAPRETLAILMAWAVEDAKDAESAALWCQFLSLGAIDTESAQILTQWYEALSSEVAMLVGAVKPGLAQAESMAIATLLIAMVDGLSVRMGAGMHDRARLLALEEKILAAIDSLLD